MNTKIKHECYCRLRNNDFFVSCAFGVRCIPLSYFWEVKHTERHAFYNEPINLLVTIDRNYLFPLATMLSSYAETHKGINFDNEVLYFPNGTDNDFAHDLGYSKECNPFPITDYLKNLPSVVINGKKYRFINGVGYGFDSYCCKAGDELKSDRNKRANYISIAIKGLLFHYKPTNAKVTVDGKTHTYKKVWMAPTMNGRFYGGGMMPTPNQDRKSKEKTLSVMVLHGSGKLKTLCVFPSIFKGKHIKHTKMVEILTGHEIKVEYDRPIPLHIDGEMILGVTSYTARSPITENVKPG